MKKVFGILAAIVLISFGAGIILQQIYISRGDGRHELVVLSDKGLAQQSTTVMTGAPNPPPMGKALGHNK